MAGGLIVGDQVYVTASRVPGLNDTGRAFYRAQIEDRNNRSIFISLPGGQLSEAISTRYAHRKIGVCILEFGDFESEATLLDPLSKAILQNCRILFGDDGLVKNFKIRSREELRHIWQQGMIADVDYIIIIGHGSRDGKVTLGAIQLRPAELLSEMPFQLHQRWKFIFTACQLGRAAFAKEFSGSRMVDHLVAPFHSVHGAIASQFVQTYLVCSLLEGQTPAVAFRNSLWAMPTNVSFRMWRNGYWGG